MGRWNDVDRAPTSGRSARRRSRCSSGLPVHEAETAGEMLVAAATRPARSLARVLNNAPFALVAMVDRALAYERDHRFPDATTFRAELAKVRAALTDETISKTQVIGASAGDPCDRPRCRRAATATAAAIAASASTRSTRARTARKRSSACRRCSRCSSARSSRRKQYSEEHPETEAPHGRVLQAARLGADDLRHLPGVELHARTRSPRGDNVIWEPEPPWNRIPYQLFSDGVRTMGLVPGPRRRRVPRVDRR